MPQPLLKLFLLHQVTNLGDMSCPLRMPTPMTLDSAWFQCQAMFQDMIPSYLYDLVTGTFLTNF